MISPSERVIARIDGLIGWMIFNNLERNNALSLDMWKAIHVILDHYGNNADVRIIVVCGAGDKAFSSGADIQNSARCAQRRTRSQVTVVPRNLLQENWVPLASRR